MGTVLHELGHALGMSHEQSRPDRDQYVNIHRERIRSGKAHNFDISAKGQTLWALLRGMNIQLMYGDVDGESNVRKTSDCIIVKFLQSQDGNISALQIG